MPNLAKAIEKVIKENNPRDLTYYAVELYKRAKNEYDSNKNSTDSTLLAEEIDRLPKNLSPEMYKSKVEKIKLAAKSEATTREREAFGIQDCLKRILKDEFKMAALDQTSCLQIYTAIYYWEINKNLTERDIETLGELTTPCSTVQIVLLSQLVERKAQMMNDAKKSPASIDKLSLELARNQLTHEMEDHKSQQIKFRQNLIVLRAGLASGKQLLSDKITELKKDEKKVGLIPQPLIPGTIDDEGGGVDYETFAARRDQLDAKSNSTIIDSKPSLHSILENMIGVEEPTWQVGPLPTFNSLSLYIDNLLQPNKVIKPEEVASVYATFKAMNDNIISEVKKYDQEKGFLSKFKEWANDVVNKIFGFSTLSVKGTLVHIHNTEDALINKGSEKLGMGR